MGKPLVIHYLWYYSVKSHFIIACGKRDVYDALLTTHNKPDVTCIRCQQTLRFKENHHDYAVYRSPAD